MTSVNVKPAEENDAQEIFTWRNDEISRRMSHSMNTVEWASHLKWYLSSLNNPNTCLLVCYLSKKNEKVGVVRFTIKNSVALTSINIAPVMRGKGLATICLNNSISFFKKKYVEIANLEAEIKSNNIASRRAFEQVGFVLKHTKNGVGYFIRSIA